LEKGAKVSAFFHDAVWIDVNDAASLTRAEGLLTQHAAAFDCRPAPPHSTIVSAVLCRSDQIILEYRGADSSRYPQTWDLPGSELQFAEAAQPMLYQELRSAFGIDLPSSSISSVFDDLDPSSGKVYRHVVFPVDLGDQQLRSSTGRVLRAFPLRLLEHMESLAPAVRRAFVVTRFNQAQSF
jgi:hypothetical protein